jgi:hypothetical protein
MVVKEEHPDRHGASVPHGDHMGPGMPLR